MTDIQQIYSPVDLAAFVQWAQDDSLPALCLKELRVHIDQPFPIATLRECLNLARCITDLDLYLPSDVAVDILDGTVLKKLEFFRTNLPHAHLVPFLALHPRLNDIVLGQCQRNAGTTCPLRLLSCRPFLAVECPSTCIPGVVHPRLYRLAGHQASHTAITAPTALRTLRAPLAALERLTLDFAPDDYDLLDSVVPIAPQLRALKLLEKPRIFRRKVHRRRAWNDAHRWAQNLARLDSLEELALRTAAAISFTKDAAGGEKKVLMKWVTGTTGRSANSVSEHPTLSALRIWYHRHTPGDGVLTMWSKFTGTWRNIHRSVNPQDVAF